MYTSASDQLQDRNLQVWPRQDFFLEVGAAGTRLASDYCNRKPDEARILPDSFLICVYLLLIRIVELCFYAGTKLLLAT